MLTQEDMKKLLAGVVAGRLKPTGLPMNRAKLDALLEDQPNVLAAKKKTPPATPAK
jgi:hypothetical protein